MKLPLGDLFDELVDRTIADQKGIAALVAGSISRNLTSKTWLRGLSDVIEAVNDPDRFGQRYIQNLAGTVVPTGVAQFSRSQDPFLRESRSVLDKVRERIPGFRETLPFRRDMFGEPIKLEGGIGPDILSPIYFSTADDDPVVAEMLKLGVAPSKPTRSIRDVELTPEQYDTFQVSTGQNAKRLLDMLTKQPGWENLSDEVKKDAMLDVFRQSRDLGRAVTVMQFPELRNAILQQRMEVAQ